MAIRFEIEELGPLRNTSFELSPFLLFSGQSNMGKSYVGFLVYAFFKILNDHELLGEYIQKKYNTSSIYERLEKDKEIEISFSIEDFMAFVSEKIPSLMAYLTGNPEINCKIKIFYINIKDNFTFRFSFSKLLSAEGYTIENVFFNTPFVIIKNGTYLFSTLASLLGKTANFLVKQEKHERKNFLFSTGRGNLLTASFTEKEKYAVNLGMHKEFLYATDSLLSPDYHSKIEENAFLTQLKNEIFGGEIKNRDGTLSYQRNSLNIPLKSAASSVKELSALYFLLNKIQPQGFSLLFEEPETHLHPNLQRKLANLLAYLVNQGAYLQITTHSDYMMQQWDFLIMLYYIKEKFPAQFENIAQKTGLDMRLALNPTNVAAYIFEYQEDNSVKMRKTTISAEEVLPFDSFQEIIEEMSEQRCILWDILQQKTSVNI